MTAADWIRAEPPRLALIGVPTDAGASRRGACLGPAALRIAGLTERLTELGYAVEDHGDIDTGARIPLGTAPRGPAAARLSGVGALGAAVSRSAFEVLQSGVAPLFLGGDHSLSMGSVSGVARFCHEAGRPLFVLWMDAHTDYNTPSTSPTGNPHGMSLAFLCGEKELVGLGDVEWQVRVNPVHVSVLGARSIDPEERHLLQRAGVSILDMRSVDERGISALVGELIQRVTAARGHLHVSLDVDVMDPPLAPGVATTVPGGLTYREAHLAMEMLHDAGIVGSLDIVELNPMMDHAGMSAALLVDLVSSLFGRQIVGRTAPRGDLA